MRSHARFCATSFWSAALLLAAFSAAGWVGGGRLASGASLQDYRVHKMRIGGPFTLIDQNGARWALRDFRGQPVLLAFGFTHCPDICPATVNTMSTVLRKLGPRAKEARMVFITVDPERDTPEKLKQYLGFFHPDMVGLTGPLSAIKQVTGLFRAPFKKLASDSAGGYQVGHVSFYYLLDREGQVVFLFPHRIDVDTLLDGVTSLLKG